MIIPVEFCENERNATIPVEFCDTEINGMVPVSVQDLVVLADYGILRNKPQIEGIELNGNITFAQLGLRNIYYDTTANWAVFREPSKPGALYIWKDWKTLSDGTVLPGLKVGDGLAYPVDLPFLNENALDQLLEHINNMRVHVSPEDRVFWDNKVSAFMSHAQSENLVLSKTQYEIGGIIYG